MSPLLGRAPLGAVLAALALTACVTVNIYFPAAAAEKAADSIIEDVWGARPPASGATPDQGSRRPASGAFSVALWRGVVDLLIPAARAQQVDLNVDTPTINAIKDAMAARFPRLKPYLDKGVVGLSRDGLLDVRDLGAASLAERPTVQGLVSQENQDRNRLYREIALANGQPQWEADIRATFARRWIDNARRGWWYQDRTGWRQK